MAELNFRVNDYLIDLDKRTIKNENNTQRISESEKLILLTLIKAEGDYVARDELLRKAWPGVVVSEASLIQAISNIRKKLGDQERVKRIILTGDTGGYAVSDSIVSVGTQIEIEKKIKFDSVIVCKFFFLGIGLCFLAFLIVLSYFDIMNENLEQESFGSVSVYSESLTDSQKASLIKDVSSVIETGNDEIYISASKNMLTVMSKTGERENLLIWGWEDEYETAIEEIKIWYHYEK
ncbi:winged helix-turn-helix domain-containing protein [Shewanella sp. MMG014]|uniref:winged helix-turn-helix domain-containing protein n=1 Tax=Shewanella sp. MMG014 TaxID=2822691 RepID=UPI001B391B29|nr:winged helix-turn-helix domain-containing protein [Shewanella sp. MMG014]MBQ4892302.1 winged helix-turn-helix domain-containing protein [Shewanella sp. MMG014]